MDTKDIGVILFLGCNGGHFDRRYTNVAHELLVKNNVDSVIAADGTVYSWRRGIRKESKRVEYWTDGDEHFKNYLWKGEGYTRDDFGFIKYSVNNRGELIWDILGSSFANINNIFNRAGY